MYRDLSKTEAAPDDDGSDSDDMERRPGGRRSGRRRRASRGPESPGAAPAAPLTPAADGPAAGLGDPEAPAGGAAPERKGRSRAAPDVAASPESKAGAGPRGQPRPEPERPRPPPPAASPTKRRGRSRLPEAAPAPPAGGPRTPARESPPKKLPALPDPGPAAKGGAADGGGEEARVVPRELTVKSSSLLPEFRPEHKRGAPPGHLDGRAKEPGRAAGGADPDGPKARNHFGAGRSTVTTKVTLPKPKNVELNFKSSKNPDNLGTEHNPFSQPVHKGNTANKISLFENKRAGSSPKHAEIRGARNTPASSKTFVGRAKLNLAKKAKEMEQPEKKALPVGQQNGVLGKESSPDTKDALPQEETGTGDPAAKGPEGEPSAGEVQVHQPGDQAGGQADAGCLSELAGIAQVPVKDHRFLGEAAGSDGLGLGNLTAAVPAPAAPASDSSAPEATPKPQDKVSDSPAPAESSPGSAPAPPAPASLEGPHEACAQVPVSSFPSAALRASGNQNGGASGSPGSEKTPPCALVGGIGADASLPPPAEHGPEAAGTDCPSKVLVQVRSFVLPVESAQGASAQLVAADSSEVREVQLPRRHSNDLEVVSVASCAPQKEEVPGSTGAPPNHPEHGEAPAATSGPRVVPLGTEKALLPQAPSQGDRTPLRAEPGPANGPGGGPGNGQDGGPVNGQDGGPGNDQDGGPVNGQDGGPGNGQDSGPVNGHDGGPGNDQDGGPVNGHDGSPGNDQDGGPGNGQDGGPVNSQASPGHLLNTSAGSDVLDSSSDMEKFTEIIKKMDSSVCVPQKKKKPRPPNSPAPHFAMPPIHEDNLEKVFDPSVFTFGLGSKKESPPDASPALQLMQNLDTKAKLRPKRTSSEQSVLFKSLHPPANGGDQPLGPPDASGKDSREVLNGGVKRSRLEKSALFSSILSSLPQDKVFSPSVTSVNTMTTTFGSSQGTSLSRSAALQPGADGAPPCGADTQQPPLAPSALKVFNFDSAGASHSGRRSPSYMEKYLQKEAPRQEPDARSSLHRPEAKFSEYLKLRSEDADKAGPGDGGLKASLPGYGGGDTDYVGLFKSSRFDPSVSFSGLSLSEATTLRGSGPNKVNPRPGKMVVYGEPDVSEKCVEVFGDLQDCSSWNLSPVILIKVVRGCWILYEKPNFEGHSIPLEEGELELTGLWGVEETLEKRDEEESAKPVVIGSIRHVVQDYRISQIDLFTEPEGLGILNSYFDDTEEMQGFGVMQKTCSIKVHQGTWLIYEGPGFQGIPFILEPGEYPDLSFWDTKEAYIGSMRPLKMGGRKVEFPTDPKVVIYEKPFFEGKCLELETELCSLTEGGDAKETAGEECLPLAAIGSMKVLRGIWVAYEKPGFTGHQYLLEEGEYKEWKDWGGYNGELQSLRPILGDFSNAHMIMYGEKNFSSKGSSIDVLGIVANLKETGYGVKTQSINVLSGVWVAYENPDFTGEQYVLDKGFYTSFEDWGGKNCKISSVQPICLDSFSGPRRRNQIHLFSEPQFQGSSQRFEETTHQIDGSFSAKSCRVLGGSWVAYDGENFSGNQYVLEEGHYPCLSAMGCLPGATFKSLRFVDAEFSEPTIILYEREDFKGKKMELNAETVNLRSLGFNTLIRSVQVIGGIWVTYEYSGYRGRQFLLSPADVPNWYEFSGCRQIGSLRPFVQKRIYFRLRNKATGLFMSTNGNLEDLKLLRIQVMEDVGADDQIWIYQEGCIKCRIAEDCCMTIVGSLVTSGSKLGLALDQNADSQFWSMKSDGRIYSKLKPNLVLDVKGGAQYDQNHVILNTVSQDKPTQLWEATVL